jgi:Flp pilus assembly protein TadG
MRIPRWFGKGPLTRKVRAYLEANEGATAVEFALVAGPFFFILFGLIEVMMIFLLSATLENGVSEAARQIRTGQVQADGSDATAFRTVVCGNLFGLMDCGARMRVDVRIFNDFTNTTNNSPVDGDGNIDDAQFVFEPGEAGDIVLVRVFYEWNVITPVLGAPLSNMNGGKRLLQAATAFRNEPFGTT